MTNVILTSVPSIWYNIAEVRKHSQIREKKMDRYEAEQIIKLNGVDPYDVYARQRARADAQAHLGTNDDTEAREILEALDKIEAGLSIYGQTK